MTTSLKVGLKRLEKLADFLEALPRKQFDFGIWGQKTPKCGTVACALGWAPSVPCIRRAGLFNKLENETDSDGKVIAISITPTCENGDDPTEAAEIVFGIDGYEAQYLFTSNFTALYEGLRDGPDYNATPKQVAKHIRRFVAWKRAQVTA